MRASLGGGMLLFMTVSMITPLSATIVNVGLCLAGGLLFASGLGALSTLILKKQAWFKTILSNEKRQIPRDLPIFFMMIMPKAPARKALPLQGR